MLRIRAETSLHRGEGCKDTRAHGRRHPHAQAFRQLRQYTSRFSVAFRIKLWRPSRGRGVCARDAHARHRAGIRGRECPEPARLARKRATVFFRRGCQSQFTPLPVFAGSVGKAPPPLHIRVTCWAAARGDGSICAGRCSVTRSRPSPARMSIMLSRLHFRQYRDTQAAAVSGYSRMSFPDRHTGQGMNTPPGVALHITTEFRTMKNRSFRLGLPCVCTRTGLPSCFHDTLYQCAFQAGAPPFSVRLSKVISNYKQVIRRPLRLVFQNLGGGIYRRSDA